MKHLKNYIKVIMEKKELPKRQIFVNRDEWEATKKKQERQKMEERALKTSKRAMRLELAKLAKKERPKNWRSIRTEVVSAEAILKKELGKGPKAASEVRASLRSQGISASSITIAAKNLVLYFESQIKPNGIWELKSKQGTPPKRIEVNRKEYQADADRAALIADSEKRAQRAINRGKAWEERELKRLKKNEGAPKYMRSRTRSNRSWNGKKQ